MRRLVRWWPRDRRQAQTGATLIELLVSVVIIGLALTLIIGTFSTGLLDAALAKRNTAAVAVVQYELDQISGGSYDASATAYSDCFATEDVTSAPRRATSFQGGCTGGSYTLRVDVTCNGGTCVPPNTTQTWSVTVVSLSNAAQIGSSVQIIKVNR